MEHRITLIGDIDHEMLRRLTKRLDFIRCKPRKPVQINLCSDGGDASIALAMHDLIKSFPYHITVTAMGLVASAAVLVLAAGDERKMTVNSWVMVHDDTPGNIEGKRVSEISKSLKNNVLFETQWNEILASDTGTSAKEWNKLHIDETYLTPIECKRLNLITEIV